MALLEPRLAVLDETDSGLDIDALKIVAGRRQSSALAGALRSSSSPTISVCSTTSCRTWCTCCRRAASCAPAARNWRWSWKRRATPNMSARGRVSAMAELTPYARRPKRRSFLALIPDFSASAGVLGRCAGRAQLAMEAFETLKAKDLPTRRVEEWKYTRSACLHALSAADCGCAIACRGGSCRRSRRYRLDLARCTSLPAPGERTRCVERRNAEGFDWYRLAIWRCVCRRAVTQAPNRERSHADNTAARA